MSQQVVVATPADMDLQEDPIRANWIIDGDPKARSKRLATSEDGTSWIVTWSCTAGRFHWHYFVDETVHVLSGGVVITDEKGRKRQLGPGDMAFFPTGTHSIWHVTNEVRKLAICRQSIPAPLRKCIILWNKIANRLFRHPVGGRPAAGAIG